MPVPTTVVCGALGVGKTTAIRGLFEHRPAHERWAVLVNEFGTVGIDGAVLDAGGVEVREIAGGCICCTAGPMLRTALVRLLREVRPDRLLVEPTGLAHPASIVDLLRSPGIREEVGLRATIGLVDPRRFLASRDVLYEDQVLAADVLVSSWADVVPEETLDRFREAAAARWPPPAVVAVTSHGRLDPAWLELRPSPPALLRSPPAASSAAEHGWTWPPSAGFDPVALEEAVQDLVRDGVLRVKGIFRTPRGWLLVQATADRVAFEPVGWRRDSRVSVILAARPASWDRVEAALVGALKHG
jgi:G3E family GTPase